MKGILVIGYGSNYPDAVETVKHQCAILAEVRNEKVYYAYHIINTPSVPEVMKTIASDGVDELLIIPFLIADGKTTSEIFPKDAGMNSDTDNEVVVDGKTIKVIWAEAIGKYPKLVDSLANNLWREGAAIDSPILLIAHSADGDNHDKVMDSMAEGLRIRGYKHVFVSFNERREPTVEKAIKQALELKSPRIVVVPLFMSYGTEMREEIPQKLGLGNHFRGGIRRYDGSSVEVRIVRSLGNLDVTSEVMEAIAAKAFD